MSKKSTVVVHDGSARVIPLGGSRAKPAAPKPKSPVMKPQVPNPLAGLTMDDVHKAKKQAKADFAQGYLDAEKTLAEIEQEEAVETSRRTRRQYDKRMGRAFKK